MSLFPRPSHRTKFCFVYCGPEACDCGILDPITWNIPPVQIEPKPEPEIPVIEIVERK